MKPVTTPEEYKIELRGDEAHQLAQAFLMDVEMNFHTRPDYTERLAKVIRNYGDERAKAAN